MENTKMENQNQTMQETLNEMHAAIDRFKAAFTTLVESIEKPAGSTAALTEEMKKEIITDVCDNISEVKIREEVVEKLVENFDTDDIAERVADSIDTSDIADKVADSVTDDIDKDDIENRVVEKIEDSIDKDEIAEKIAGRLTDKILHALRVEVNS
jgi:hypothetical protein